MSTPTTDSLSILEATTTLKLSMQMFTWNGTMYCKFWRLLNHSLPAVQSVCRSLSLHEWLNAAISFVYLALSDICTRPTTPSQLQRRGHAGKSVPSVSTAFIFQIPDQCAGSQAVKGMSREKVAILS